MSEEGRERQPARRPLMQPWPRPRALHAEEPDPVSTGDTNVARAEVPWALDLAAAWSWRMLLIGVAVLAIGYVLAFFAVITVPLAISMLFAALGGPAVVRMSHVGVPRRLGAAFVVVGGIAGVVLLLTFVGRQIAEGSADLADSVVTGIGQVKSWLREGPLGITDTQLDRWLSEAQASITEGSRDNGVVTRALALGTTLGHVGAGFFIVIFASYFFLADGHRMWAWAVHLAPRVARTEVDASGRVAWISLTQFVRATVVVAFFDAVGVMIIAALLQVPFVFAIGVLVFLGAFVPMVGATVAGAVAILVALVDQGPLTAVLMLGGVILVQQIEGHVLQPFLMGRFVSLHPLGVIVAIGCGVLLAGVVGALIAVPLAAAGNAVVLHLAQGGVSEEDPVDSDDDARERVEQLAESRDDSDVDEGAPESSEEEDDA